jgi:hypothetical protein
MTVVGGAATLLEARNVTRAWETPGGLGEGGGLLVCAQPATVGDLLDSDFKVCGLTLTDPIAAGRKTTCFLMEL